MWVIIILILILALFIYYAGIKPVKYWDEKGVPALKAWPFVGHFGQTVIRTRAIAHIIDDNYKAFPANRYCGFYIMTTPGLIIRDPELLKQITVKEFDTFPEHRPILPEDVDPLWSKNLFAMKGGERWQDMRATLSPSFTSSKMRTMFELMRECSKQFSAYFLKQNDIVTVEMKNVFTRFTNDVIATTAFGVTCDSLEHQNNEFYLMGKEATTFTGIRSIVFLLQGISPSLATFLKIPIFPKPVAKFFRGIIKETIKVREEKGIFRPDMIHLLLEARKGRLNFDENASGVIDSGFAVAQESAIGKTRKGNKSEITDEDITAQALVFFFAGFDTVSTMMSYTSYELAINPDIQARLREEVDEALTKSNGQLTYETLLGMKYLDMVLSESLRKWPPFHLVDRRSVKPFTIQPELMGENPLTLDTGAVCLIPIYSIHRDEQHYPNPDKFDPERFSDENKHNIKPFTYLPFGLGPRNCIGSRFALLEGKLVLAEIISKFKIVPVEKTQIPITLSKKGFSPLPVEGLWLGLKPRNDNKL